MGKDPDQTGEVAVGERGKMIMGIEKQGLQFFLENIKGLVQHNRDCYIGVCPQCRERELRVFEMDLEARCASCSWWTFGIEEFAQRAMDRGISLGKEEAPTPEIPVKAPDLRKLEGESKGRMGICQVCGDPFEIPTYIRRAKRYCSSRCRKRAQRMREKGHNLGDKPEKSPTRQTFKMGKA